jgi:hypothetical protein
MTADQPVMRFAYADPPYPGMAKRHYADQPTYVGEVDHAALTERLAGYDGWALSTRMATLGQVLAVCPGDVRVACWHVPDAPHPGRLGRWWWSWEPVIVRPARLSRDDLGPVVRDVLTRAHQLGTYNAGVRVLTGQKSPEFCQWVLNLLGYRDGDTLDDLFPGSGVMGRVAAQRRIAL